MNTNLHSVGIIFYQVINYFYHSSSININNVQKASLIIIEVLILLVYINKHSLNSFPS